MQEKNMKWFLARKYAYVYTFQLKHFFLQKIFQIIFYF